MTLGGAGVYASNLCRELAKLGHEVHVISSSLKNKTTQTSGIFENVFVLVENKTLL